MITLDLSSEYKEDPSLRIFLNIHVQSNPSIDGCSSQELSAVAREIIGQISGRRVLNGCRCTEALAPLEIRPMNFKGVLDRSLEYAVPENQRQFTDKYAGVGNREIAVKVNICFLGDLCFKLEQYGHLTREEARRYNAIFSQPR